MKKLVQIVGHLTAAASAILIPLAARAQSAPEFPPLNPVDNVDFIEVLQRIANFMLGLAGGIAVIYLIWAGIQYITGGAKGAQTAKDAIVNAIIGIAVILLAWVIVQTVVTVIR